MFKRWQIVKVHKLVEEMVVRPSKLRFYFRFNAMNELRDLNETATIYGSRFRYRLERIER